METSLRIPVATARKTLVKPVSYTYFNGHRGQVFQTVDIHRVTVDGELSCYFLYHFGLWYVGCLDSEYPMDSTNPDHFRPASCGFKTKTEALEEATHRHCFDRALS